MRQKYIRLDLDLGTPSGVSSAGVILAETVFRDMLAPVMQRTPPPLRGDLFERFFCGMCGAMIAELGPDRTKQVCDAAKLAIDDFTAELNRHAH